MITFAGKNIEGKESHQAAKNAKEESN